MADALAVCEVMRPDPWPESDLLVPTPPDSEGFVFAVPQDLEFFGDEDQARGFGQAVKQLGQTSDVPPSALVTVTSRAMGAAAGLTVTFAVSDVGEAADVELTVTSGPKDTTAPSAKFDPVSTMS